MPPHSEDYPRAPRGCCGGGPIGLAYGLIQTASICRRVSYYILNFPFAHLSRSGLRGDLDRPRFLVLPVATMRPSPRMVCCARDQFQPPCRRDPGNWFLATDQLVWLANPKHPYRNLICRFDEVKRCARDFPRACAPCADAAYSYYVLRTIIELGPRTGAPTENTVMTHTFSKIHGLAALRLA